MTWPHSPPHRARRSEGGVAAIQSTTEPLELTVEDYPPTYIGPTWYCRDGQYVLPEKTLGWEIAGWTHEYLIDPNSDAQEPKPWRFTNEQLRFVLWWYAVDENGRFPFRLGVLQRLKGWGKDPLLAALCMVELLGPSRFSHWGKDGNPVGKAHPAAWVQIAATAKDQTKTTMRMFPLIISEKLKSEFGIEVGIEFIRALNGRVNLESVTSNPRTLEGGRITFALLNETHHWLPNNNGIDMYLTAMRNASKLGNRYLAITNAYLPGEDSVAERMRFSYEEIVEGRSEDIGFLYDSIEAHPNTPLSRAGLEFAIPLIRGDSYWVTAENVASSALLADVSAALSRRMYLNQIVAGEDALYEEENWDCLEDDDQLRPNDKIVLGFDGGKSEDATALVAIRVEDGFIQPLLIEEPPRRTNTRDEDAERWEVDRGKVDAAVRSAFRMYEVVGFYADVKLWESNIVEWTEDFGHKLTVKANANKPIEWDMRGAVRRVTFANEALVEAILNRKLKHRPKNDRLTLTLRRHLLNAVRRENDYGVSFSKESRQSPKKVDGYAALMIAHACLTDYRSKKKEAPRTGRAWFL